MNISVRRNFLTFSYLLKRIASDICITGSRVEEFLKLFKAVEEFSKGLVCTIVRQPNRLFSLNLALQSMQLFLLFYQSLG